MRLKAKIIVAALSSTCMAVPVGAQDTQTRPLISTTTEPALQSPNQGESPFLLEPEFQIKGDEIKRETYRSQPAGQNQNWNLDIGRFQPRLNEDPNGIVPDQKETYSGMRLRLPLRGGTGQ